MKKAILTVGLFSLMMVLTSFTSPEIGGGQTAPRDPNAKQTEIGGGQTAPRGFAEIGGGQTAPRGYAEIGGGQTAPRDPNAREIGGGQTAPRG